jgi:hypothetical protein
MMTGYNITPRRRMPLTLQTTRTAATGRYLRRHKRADGLGQYPHLPPRWSDARRRRKPPRQPRLHYGDATPSSETTPCEL